MIDLIDKDMIYKRYDEKLKKFTNNTPKPYKFVDFIISKNGELVAKFPANEYERHLDLIDSTLVKQDKNAIIRDSFLLACFESHLGIEQYMHEDKMKEAWDVYMKDRPEIIVNFNKAMYEKYCPELSEEDADKILRATRTYVDEGTKGSLEMVERLFVTFVEAWNNKL